MLIRLTAAGAGRPYPILVNTDQIITVKPNSSGGASVETTGRSSKGQSDTIQVTESLDEIENKVSQP